MFFHMNDMLWQILEKPQEEFWKDENKISGEGVYFGKTLYKTREIWLDEELSIDQKIRTLYHELMHCYLRSYITFDELNINEETLCDVSSNSHKIIHDIADKYKELLEERGK